MMDWKFISELIWPSKHPAKVNLARTDDLYEASATRGTMILGDPGTGKTSYAAMQTVGRWMANPHPVFVFDWSGSITDSILDIISRNKNYEKLLERVVLVEQGNPTWVVPSPEFHPSYGLTDEEQVSRVVDNMENLADYMARTASFVSGVSIQEIGKNLFRLLMAIRNEHKESWQITEALELVTDENLLRRACSMFGGYAIPAKKYFEKQYLPKDKMPAHEKQLLTTTLRTILGQIDGDIARATLGYYEPRWTPKEATEQNQLVLIDAHKMINLEVAQHYLLTQAFSQVMYWINKREVNDPANNLVEIIFDETVSILDIPGFAKKLGMVSPLYRSRKVSLTIIAQALWQFDEKLAEQIWTLANVVCFQISNAKEAEIIVKQLFPYDPKFVKSAAKTEYQNPTIEPVLGQDRIYADWLQNLNAREFIMRRYITEQKKEKGIQFVEKTADYPSNPPDVHFREIKKWLIEKRGVKIRDSLEVSSRRKLAQEDQGPPQI